MFVQDVPGRYGTSTASKVMQLLGWALIGVTACAIAIRVADFNRRTLVLGLLGLLVPVFAAVTKQPKKVLLFAWVQSLAYNHSYFSFDAVFGNNGVQGPYWIPADIFLLCLLGLWAYDAVRSKQVWRARGGSLWPWYLPFLAICLLSTLGAYRMNWAAFEMLRPLKIAVIFLYIRHNFEREDWWVCIAALGCAVALQSSLGILQVMKKGSSGVLSLLGLGGDVDPNLQGIEASLGQGWNRAKGSMAEPNILATYLELTTPVFLALTVAARGGVVRGVCAFSAVVGLAGLGLTLSRFPWMVGAVEVAILAIGLMRFGEIRLQQVIGLASVGSLALALALLPFRHQIMERVTADFSESIDVRVKLNRVALDIFSKHPFIGVGLNNLAEVIPTYGRAYDLDLDWYMESRETMRTDLSIRAMVAIHNLYLQFLAETGIFGLAALLTFLLGTIQMGVRAVRATDGLWRAASFGMLVGLFGVLAQEMTGFELWTDPVLYTFALIVGLLNVAPALAMPAEGQG